MADYFRKVKSLYASTANTFGTGTGVTITPASVSGLPTDTEITLTFDRVDSSGSETPSAMERIIGTISGGNFVVRTSPSTGRGADGTSDAAHTSPVVEYIPNAKDMNDTIDGILIGHTQAGLHAASLPLTTPKITTSINDANGNEVIKTPATATAVNEITVTNSATGNAVSVAATGGDTNIDFELTPKGTGVLKSKTTVELEVVAAGTDTSTGDAKRFFRIPKELDGFNLVDVAGVVYTAGTTNTTDIQIRNKTQTADMLSTKLTIDSGETDSATAAAAAVIDTANDDVAWKDVIAIDIDAVSTTAAKGLVVALTFAKP